MRKRIVGAVRGFRNPEGIVTPPSLASSLPTEPRKRYEALRLRYAGEAYREGNAELFPGVSDARGLENPFAQVVEFYPAHLFPGTLPDALPLVDASETVVRAIRDLWVWSNWGHKKQVYARWLPLYGNAFLKATQATDGRPYKQLIHPSRTTEFEKDERGNVVYAFLETEIQNEDATAVLVRCEEWSKEDDAARVWFASGYGSSYAERSADYAKLTYQKKLSDFGIDFVPLVHAPFVADPWEPDGLGLSAISGVVEQVDEINQAITALHDRFFRYGKPDKVFKANESGKGAPRGERRDSRPDPGSGHDALPNGAKRIDLRGEETYYLPGLVDVAFLIPNIPYGDGLAMIRARQDKLSENLPELRYYQDAGTAETGSGNISGLSRRIRLAPAVSRALEARGNAEDALVRVQKMCLTLGANAGRFPNVGSFEAGDFDHSFEEREILPVSDEERWEAAQKKLAAYRDAAAILGPEKAEEAFGFGFGQSASESTEGLPGVVGGAQGLVDGLLSDRAAE